MGRIPSQFSQQDQEDSLLQDWLQKDWGHSYSNCELDQFTQLHDQAAGVKVTIQKDTWGFEKVSQTHRASMILFCAHLSLSLTTLGEP